MKRFISGLIVGMILMCAIPSLAKTNTIQALYNGIKVVINGNTVSFAPGDEPVTINDHTYVQAKYVAEALGAKVKWDCNNNTVFINKTTTAGNHYYWNGKINLATEKTSDGLNIYTYNDGSQKYVSTNELNLYSNTVKFGITLGSPPNSDSIAMKNAAGSKDLIGDLEYIVINDLKYITLEYYEKTILPMIKAEGN
jgi:hypothetical protein